MDAIMEEKLRLKPTLPRITAAEPYRNHLIFVTGELEPETNLWTAHAHIQFNESSRTFRDVWLPTPTGRFETKKQSEEHMMKEAKKWIDDKIGDSAGRTLYPKITLKSVWRWILNKSD
jgi:hypothetical protein